MPRALATADRQDHDDDKSALQTLSVEDLEFDELNPRLPEGTIGGARGRQLRIAEYFEQEGNLDELARSFADNGYFKTEPVIVTQDGAPKGKWVVLEGNRRLAALRLMLAGSPKQLASFDVKLTPAKRGALSRIPALEVRRREDATVMIGYRHIGGLKFWDSEAKARWICDQVERRAKESDPFTAVARMVGMNRAPIRYYYLAGSLAAAARDEAGYDLSLLTRLDRFGVWLRAVENPDVRAYIGLGEVTEHKECLASIKAVRRSPKRLIQVLDDIAKPMEADRTRVGDSRNIARYGEVLRRPDAVRVFRADGLEAALEVLRPDKVLGLARKVLVSVQKLRVELDKESSLEGDLVDVIGQIKRAAKGLRSED